MIMLALTLIIVAVVIILIFNRLIRYTYLLREAESGIDVQLKRRHDLIPNIVESVKGYKQFESQLLSDITSLRSQLGQVRSLKDREDEENGLSAALKTVFAVAENYPDLKANQSFLELQKTLSQTEDDIQLARRYYNGTVRDYNTAVQSFPANIVAATFSFKSAAFFEITYATERQVPDVKF